MGSTPNQLTDEIRDFCANITLTNHPEWVDVAPRDWCTQGECFYNVRNMVQANHGNALNGWCIWQHNNMFVEAEHHCVWESPENDLIDVTPKQDNEQAILFLPDQDADFDWSRESRRKNIRVPLTNCSNLRLLLRLLESRDLAVERCGCVETGKRSGYLQRIKNHYDPKVKKIWKKVESSACD